MFQSLKDDLKNVFKSGNMLHRVIVVNVGVFIILNLIKVFSSFSPEGIVFYNIILDNISVPADPGTLLKKPWTLISYMFVHEGFFHIFWNMLLLHWFGRIFGDFLGDQRVLGFYLLGGFAGAILFILSGLTGLWHFGSMIGASAAVMGFIVATATLSPNYLMNLLFIGPVKLKYIAIALVLLDLFSANGANSGGHLAHLGGALFGLSYVHGLRSGVDFTNGPNKILDWLTNLFSRKENFDLSMKTKKAKMTVTYGGGKRTTDSTPKFDHDLSFQEKLDKILDKIKAEGYELLSDEEKEFLFQASKK